MGKFSDDITSGGGEARPEGIKDCLTVLLGGGKAGEETLFGRPAPWELQGVTKSGKTGTSTRYVHRV